LRKFTSIRRSFNFTSRNATSLLRRTAAFPENDHVEIGEQGLVLHKPGKKLDPPNKTLIDQAITASMRPVSILDILTETEQWLDLHTLFGPLSGSPCFSCRLPG